MSLSCTTCRPRRISSKLVNGVPICDCNIESLVFEPALTGEDEFWESESLEITAESGKKFAKITSRTYDSYTHNCKISKIIFGPKVMHVRGCMQYNTTHTIKTGFSGDVITIPKYHARSGAKRDSAKQETIQVCRFATEISLQIREANNLLGISVCFTDMAFLEDKGKPVTSDLTERELYESDHKNTLISKDFELTIPLTSIIGFGFQSSSLSLMLGEPARVFEQVNRLNLDGGVKHEVYKEVKTRHVESGLDDAETCGICLGEVSRCSAVKPPCNCKTVYHRECIEKWAGSTGTCPTCRGGATQCAVTGSELKRMAGDNTLEIRVDFHGPSFDFEAHFGKVMERITKVRKRLAADEKKLRYQDFVSAQRKARRERLAAHEKKQKDMPSGKNRTGESKQKKTAHDIIQSKKAGNATKTPAPQTQASAIGASVGSQGSTRAHLGARRLESDQTFSDKNSGPFAPLNLKRPADSDTGGDEKRAKIESNTDTSHMTPMERVKKLEGKKSGEKPQSYERAATDDPDASIMKSVSPGKNSLTERMRIKQKDKMSQESLERPKSAKLSAGSSIQSMSAKPKVKSPPIEKGMFADINNKLFGGNNNYYFSHHAGSASSGKVWTSRSNFGGNSLQSGGSSSSSTGVRRVFTASSLNNTISKQPATTNGKPSIFDGPGNVKKAQTVEKNSTNSNASASYSIDPNSVKFQPTPRLANNNNDNNGSESQQRAAPNLNSSTNTNNNSEPRPTSSADVSASQYPGSDSEFAKKKAEMRFNPFTMRMEPIQEETESDGPNIPKLARQRSVRRSPKPDAKEIEIVEDAKRINRMRDGGYRWYNPILGLAGFNVTKKDVDRAYRNFMRKFHPDKMVGMTGKHRSEIDDAMEKIRKAKAAAEAALETSEKPTCITGIKHEIVDSRRGQRVIRFTWNKPECSVDAPLEKYNIQVNDPRYGKFIALATIEPDYCESEKRYKSIDELNQFDMRETDCVKLAHVFDEEHLKIQIAGQNKVGVSQFTTYTMRPKGIGKTSVGQSYVIGSKVDIGTGANNYGNGSASSSSSPGLGAGLGFGQKAASTRANKYEFENRAKNIFNLLSTSSSRRQWISSQPKNQKADFLKAKGWPTGGDNSAIDERVMTYCAMNYG